ncbi:phage tail protein [Paenibacillus harenae]|uniref:phage tail protein n=1 Tax=Paenibacillus harenae TaxID=306543 RepID=UPI00040C2D76|nr:hypothetical protein [Paenibacillus harenae]
MALVRQLMVRAGADFSAMRQEMRRAQGTIQDFKKNVSTAMKGIAAAFAAVGVGAIFKDATKAAMDFESAILQINRTMGASAGAFNQWAKDNAAAFGLAHGEAVRYGATFSNLISTFAKDASQISQYTQQLLEASAVTAAATGRTMEDTLERIRSGMLGNTEAIEDLGIFVGVSMIESTEAFRKFAGDRSWQQLDFQTQQQIRLFAILEQSANKYGTEVANSTAAQQMKFIAQLKNAQLALGQAFLPIYSVILPALTRMAQALATAANVIAQFSQALFGKTSEVKQQAKATQAQASAVSGLGDAYTEAGKAAKKASGQVQGFDEVHTISDSSGGAGAAGSAAGGLPGDALPSMDVGGFASSTVEVSEKVQEMARKVREAIGGLSSFIQSNKDIIISAMAGIGTALGLGWVLAHWKEIKAAAVVAFNVVRTAIMGVSIPITLIVAAIAAAVAAFVYFYRTNEKFKGVVDGVLKAIGDAAVWLWNDVLVPLGKFLGQQFVAAWDAFTNVATWLWKNVLVPIGAFLVQFYQNILMPLAAVLRDVLGVAFTTVANIAMSFWQNVLVPLGKALSEMFGPAVEAISAVLSFLWNKVFVPFGNFMSKTMMPIWEDVVEVVTRLWKSVLKPLSEFVGGLFFSVFDSVFKSIGEVIGGLKTAFIGLMSFITGVFTGDWGRAWEGVKQIFKGIFDSLVGIVKTPINAIIEMINKMIDSLNDIKIEIPPLKVAGKTLFPGATLKVPTIPKIPRLARGGVVDGKTNMGNYIAGEAGAEMIVPLENTSFTDKIAAALGTAVMTNMQMVQGNGKGDTIIQLNGVELARAIQPYLSGENNRLGGAMITAK